MKLKYPNVNMIVSTPNDQSCKSVLAREPWGHGLPVAQREKYTTKYTEECYNDTNIDILRTWRADQLKDDPNLPDCVCDQIGQLSPVAFSSGPIKSRLKILLIY